MFSNSGIAGMNGKYMELISQDKLFAQICNENINLMPLFIHLFLAICSQNIQYLSIDKHLVKRQGFSLKKKQTIYLRVFDAKCYRQFSMQQCLILPVHNVLIVPV